MSWRRRSGILVAFACTSLAVGCSSSPSDGSSADAGTLPEDEAPPVFEPEPPMATGGGSSYFLPSNHCVQAPLDSFDPYGFAWPCGGCRDPAALHLGEDAIVPAGTPVYAVADGVITYARNHPPHAGQPTNWGGLVYQNAAPAGTMVSIVYGHLDPTRLPAVGATLRQGDLLGYVAARAQTGFFEHIHLQLTEDGRTIAPTYAASQFGYARSTAGWQPFSSWAERIVAMPSCEAVVVPRPILIAPPDGATLREDEDIDFSWQNNTQPDPLVFSYRRCITARCSGTEPGAAVDEEVSGGTSTKRLAPGDYRWTVYLPSPLCADGRCAGAARIFTVVPAPVPACGDAACGAGESCDSCPADCGDCRPACGDGACNGAESCSSCARDCGDCVCGDRRCAPSESCATCSVDCGPCLPACGAGGCESGESCSSCPADCGSCPPACGDRTCGSGESCSSCPDDCGMCPVTTCSLVLTMAESFAFSADSFLPDGAVEVPVMSDVSVRVHARNLRSTRAYEFNRSWIRSRSGDSIEIVTANDYDNLCVSPDEVGHFGYYVVRPVRTGRTVVEWGGRYRYYAGSTDCSTTTPSAYAEDYEMAINVDVVCR